jgi:hypothetical protein
MVTRPELLKNKAVIEEINKHKWIESQKAGYDIGFEKAAEDWIGRFADEWEQGHEPKKGLKFVKKGKKEK